MLISQTGLAERLDSRAGAEAAASTSAAENTRKAAEVQHTALSRKAQVFLKKKINYTIEEVQLSS